MIPLKKLCTPPAVNAQSPHRPLVIPPWSAQSPGARGGAHAEGSSSFFLAALDERSWRVNYKYLSSSPSLFHGEN